MGWSKRGGADGMRVSGQIESLLDLLEAAQSDYDIAQGQMSDADKETQDILHWLESNEIPPVDGEGAILILGAIGMIRRDRRAAKDTAIVMQPVAEWAKTHKSTMESLKQLLGNVRRAERRAGNTHYTDRTDIMVQILGTPDDGTET